MGTVEQAIRACQDLSPGAVGDSSILYRIVSVTAFKGAIKILVISAESRCKALGRAHSILVAQRALQKISMDQLQSGMAIDFKGYFARAMQYASSLRRKSDHPDRKNFQGLVGCLLDKAAEGFRLYDDKLGDLLSLTDGATTEIAEQLDSYISDLQAHFFDKLTFSEQDFGPESSSFPAWQRYQPDLNERAIVLAMVKQFRGGTADKFHILSALKLQVNKMVVPFNDGALRALNAVLEDDALKSAGSAGYVEHLKKYVETHFGGGGVVYPKDDDITFMMRWAQWSTTPSFAKQCVSSSQAFA